MKNLGAILFVAALSFQPLVLAQTSETGLATAPPAQLPGSYYYVAKPGEVTMQVNVWGDVQRPGRYEISTSTDLVQLLSFAGGPTREADLKSVRITRTLKSDTGPRKAQLFVDLENPYETDPANLVLFPDDAIYVDYVSRFNARDILAIISAAALVTVAIAQVQYYYHTR